MWKKKKKRQSGAGEDRNTSDSSWSLFEHVSESEKATDTLVYVSPGNIISTSGLIKGFINHLYQFTYINCYFLALCEQIVCGVVEAVKCCWTGFLCEGLELVQRIYYVQRFPLTPLTLNSWRVFQHSTQVPQSPCLVELVQISHWF